MAVPIQLETRICDAKKEYNLTKEAYLCKLNEFFNEVFMDQGVFFDSEIYVDDDERKFVVGFETLQDLPTSILLEFCDEFCFDTTFWMHSYVSEKSERIFMYKFSKKLLEEVGDSDE